MNKPLSDKKTAGIVSVNNTIFEEAFYKAIQDIINEDTFIIVKDPKRVSQGKIKMVFSNNPISLKSWTITNQSKQKTKVLLRNLDEKVKIPLYLFNITAASKVKN